MASLGLALILSLAAAAGAAPEEAERGGGGRGAPTSAATARHVVCAWGTLGLAAEGTDPAWVVGAVEVTARRAIRGLRLARIELLAADGRVLATAGAELNLRVIPAARGDGDFSQHGTAPFDGAVGQGQTLRLRIHGRLNERFTLVLRSRPARYRATLVAEEGLRLVVEGPLDPPWPTA